MFQKGNKSLFKDLIIYVCVFVIVYFGVILWKYIANDSIDWLKSFIFMFFITFIYFLLMRTNKRKTKGDE